MQIITSDGSTIDSKALTEDELFRIAKDNVAHSFPGFPTGEFVRSVLTPQQEDLYKTAIKSIQDADKLNLAEGLTSYTLALNVAIELQDWNMAGYCSDKKAAYHAGNGNRDQSIEFYTDSVNYYSKIRPTYRLDLAHARLLTQKHIRGGDQEIKDYFQDQTKNFNDAKLINDNHAMYKALSALGATYKFMGQEDKAINMQRAAYDIQQGVENRSAHWIGQHEAGISATDPIGTDNVQTCVTVTVRDPKNNKTLMAHIDIGTDVAQSLENLITSAFLPINSDNKSPYLEARLIGGRSYHVEGTSNIKRVQNTLNKFDNIALISSDIGNYPFPTSIVIDPTTGLLSNEIAGKSAYKAERLVNFKFLGSQPLYKAFDLTSTDPSVQKPNFTEAQKQFIIMKSFENHQTTPNYSDIAHANLYKWPYRKICQEILQEPNGKQLVTNTLKRIISTTVTTQLDPKNSLPDESNKKAQILNKLNNEIDNVVNSGANWNTIADTISKTYKAESEKYSIAFGVTSRASNIAMNVSTDSSAVTTQTTTTIITSVSGESTSTSGAIHNRDRRRTRPAPYTVPSRSTRSPKRDSDKGGISK